MKILRRAALVAGVLVLSTMSTGAWASAKTVVQLVLADAGNTAEVQTTVRAMQTAIVEHAGQDFQFIGMGDNSPHAITVTVYAGTVSPTLTGIASAINADFISQSGYQARSKFICQLPIESVQNPTNNGNRGVLSCADRFMGVLREFANQMPSTVLRTPMRVVSASADANESALVTALNVALQSSPFFADVANGGNPHDAIVVTITKSASTSLRLRFAVQLSGPAGTTMTSAECPSNAMDGCVAEVMQAAGAYQKSIRQSGR